MKLSDVFREKPLRLLDGQCCHVWPADRQNEVEMDFIRSHVTRNGGTSCLFVLDFLNGKDSTYAALLSSSSPSRVKRVADFHGAAVVHFPEDTRDAAVLLWVSVEFKRRGNGVGRILVSEFERCCRMMHFTVAQAPRPVDTRLLRHCGYRAKRGSMLRKQLHAKPGKRADAAPLAKREASPAVPLSVQEELLCPKYEKAGAPDPPAAFTSGEIIFRALGKDDRRVCQHVALSACKFNLGGYDTVTSALGAAYLLVAARASDDRVVAFVSLEMSGWLPLLVCEPAYQGKGIGSFLLFLAMEWARRRDIPSISLVPLDMQAEEFYSRWGFDLVPKEKHESNATMIRHLVRSIFLLPDASSPARYINDYDATDEVPFTGRKCFVYARVPQKGKRPREPSNHADDDGEPRVLFLKTESPCPGTTATVTTTIC